MKKILQPIVLAAVLALGVSTGVPVIAANVNDYAVVFTTFNVGAVENSPTYFADFTVEGGDLFVQAVTTYHWNYGQGSEPGTISIYDWDDNLVGTWDAVGRSGSGANNVNWDIFPNVVLKEGTRYYFVDSDNQTWSCNNESRRMGFVEVRGTNSVPSGAEKGYVEGQTYIFTDRNGVEFRASLNAFASYIVDFSPGDPWTNDADNMDSQVVLGLPNWNGAESEASQGDLCLGGGGAITLGFTQEIFDGDGIDLYVFEVGENVEDTKVEVSPDLVTWYDAGVAAGRTAGVDFQGTIPSGTGMRYVRLTDLRSHANGTWPGADIDAVCGIHSRAPSTDTSPVYDYETIQIVLNGHELTPTDRNGTVVEPVLINGTVYVPVETISNALGLTVEWDETAGVVYINNRQEFIPEPEFDSKDIENADSAVG